ncbi:Rossmann-fold NAD(P)-binding domain-containing protein [Flammeovirga aprica]|uniref:Uncharacterized protein n=1 Tax=Flammeovirga aprica JL-4 TaxID=694437 RepID=A0A7X9RVN4_9BACT|nr:hypothetical protein [Flammeovirga aprica]NME69573.1 hypothetical protein [Flammeovirga aprica JL-4]
MKKKVTIVGVGWLGIPLSERLRERGFEVKGSVASEEELIAFEFTDQISLLKVEEDHIKGDWKSLITETEVLIVCFPPADRRDKHGVYVKQIEQLTKQTPPHQKVIFVSSTSVYPNTNQSIKESDQFTPETIGGKNIYQAEQVLRQHFGEQLTAIRMAGLIGGGRHPSQLLREKRVLKNPNVPVNVIHQTDAINLIVEVIEQDVFGEVINGCAALHPIRRDLYTNAAMTLGLPLPVFRDCKSTAYKLVDNSKSKRLLSFEYKYDDPQAYFNENEGVKIH